MTWSFKDEIGTQTQTQNALPTSSPWTFKDQTPEEDEVPADETFTQRIARMQERVAQGKPMQTPQERQAIQEEVGQLLPGRHGTLGLREEEISPEARGAASRGFISGTTLGLSETLGKKAGFFEDIPEEQREAFLGGEIAGEMGPITGFFKLTQPLVNLAMKSKVLRRSLTAAAKIAQSSIVGATTDATKQVFEGKIPDLESVGESALSWGIVDAGLQMLGAGGKFVDSLLNLSRKTGEPAAQILKEEVLTQLEKRGVNWEKPQEVANEALKIIGEEKPIPSRPVKVAEKKPVEVTREAEIAKKNLRDPDVTPRDLKERKVKPVYFDEIQVEKPGEPSKVTEREIKAEIDQPYSEELLDRHAERATTEKELGENIQESMEENFKEKKNAYTDAYEEATAGTENIKANTQNIAEEIVEEITRINSLVTKPSDYQSTLKTLNTALEDIGYKMLETRTGTPTIVSFLPEGQTVPKLIELSKRLGELVDFEAVTPTVKKAIKGTRKSVKDLARSTLKAQDTPSYEKLIEADTLYSKTVREFGEDHIKKVRYMVLPENIAKVIDKPTILKDLKKVVSPSQYKQIEREILSKFNKATAEKAGNLFREVSPYMSREGRNLAREIVESKKFTPLQKTEKWITDQFAKPGKPEGVSKLWESKEGRKEIERSLRNNPNREEITDYLKKNYLFEASANFIDSSGKIDFKKFDKFLKKESGYRAIHDVGGKEAVDFFKSLKSLQLQAEKNASIYEKFVNRNKEFYDKKPKIAKERFSKINKANKLDAEKKAAQEAKALSQIKSGFPEDAKRGKQILEDTRSGIERQKFPLITKLEDLYKKLGIPSKTILGLLGFTMAPKTAVGSIVMYKLAKNPRFRHAVKQALSQKSTNVYKRYLSQKLVDEIFEEGE